MRLDKYLSQALNLSRKQAHIAIRGGRVTVAGKAAKKLATAVGDASEVCLDGNPVAMPSARYLMLNKPAGYVSATTDGEHPTVLDLIPPELQRDLHPAGRLDIDTTGLVLLSSDGQWTHRITSPRHRCAKVYLAELAEPLVENAEQQFAEGILLRGEQQPTRSATLERLGPCLARVTLSEGRYHQVKRMFAALGNKVVALHREQIGELALDPTLAEGEYRHLRSDEIDSFRSGHE
ncbi:16S rRNA pseudouridine(516) synthase RsuA [Motiliproteus sediminis]|uniref:16S rRNA pseudouridine(516) synthase RsuA n=1 Tax=Motiliproteus sediminis TaxID=1468178 RepID=UPI001AEFE157|nr:16S rRNA pseudouridine(516) synthase RsuA [Motiliproteus sediminis]